MLLTRRVNYFGAEFLGSEMTLPELWVKLHELSFKWCNSPISNIQIVERARIDEQCSAILRITLNCRVAVWAALCAAAGWTSYGAVALSWCEGARLEDVWSGWLASGFPLKPLPEYERPARFLNPALLPQVESLTGLVAWVNAQHYPDAATYDLAIAAVIAGLKAPLVFDMAPEMMGAARPQVAAFLKSRMLQQASHSAEEARLIETWRATVKGSPYDIWETV